MCDAKRGNIFGSKVNGLNPPNGWVCSVFASVMSNFASAISEKLNQQKC